MSNNFHTPTADLAAGTTARAADVNDKFDAVEVGFDNAEAVIDLAIKLPVGSGNQQITETAPNRASKEVGFDANGDLALISSAFQWKGDWVTATAYIKNDVVVDQSTKNIYHVTADYTSGASVSVDVAASDLALMVNVSDIETAKTAAETAETNAETAQTAAELAETNAETAETNAETAETNASGSATTAATEATNASTSATNAATSATSASTSATNAATSETNAATSETNAATSATSSATSATNSATSATNAAADLVLTNADVVLTNADVVLTHADELLTRADTVATAADRAAVAAALATGILASAYQFTGDGTTVDFTLSGGITDIPNSQSIIVDIDGVTQHTDTYTVSGKVVTFSVAPPLNGDIQVRYNAYLGTATDASGITYNQGGTGASSRTVENKLQESVSVKDFGAVGDGTTDDTAAIQAAIDYCKLNNTELKLNGWHRTTSCLEYHTDGTSSGLTISGQGRFSSGLIGDFVGDSLLSFDGSSSTGWKFQRGGGISNLGLKTTPTAVIKRAITTVGWWDASLSNIEIGIAGTITFTEDGIYIPEMTSIDSNPDGYASVNWSLSHCRITDVSGSGIRGYNTTGYAGWVISSSQFERCGENGLSINTNGWLVSNTSCSYNDGYGIKLYGSSGFTLSPNSFSSMEIDGNGTAGVYISRVTAGVFNRCRFISRVLDGSETSLKHVEIDSAYVALSLTFTDTYHRVEAGMTSGVTFYSSDTPSSNISGLLVKNYSVLDSGAGGYVLGSIGIIERPQYNNILIDSTGSSSVSYQQFIIKTRSTITTIPNSVAAILWDTGTENTGWETLNDPLTGEIEMPHDGCFKADIQLTINNVVTGARLFLGVYVNGVAQDFQYYDYAAGITRMSHSISLVFNAGKGDAVEFRANCGGSGHTVYGDPTLRLTNI